MSNATDRGKGLFAAPSYIEEFEAFDRLPQTIRRALDVEAHENYSALEVEAMLSDGYAEAEILRMICPRNTSLIR